MKDADDIVLNEARAIFKRAARLEHEASTQKHQAARLMEHVKAATRDPGAKPRPTSGGGKT